VNALVARSIQGSQIGGVGGALDRGMTGRIARPILAALLAVSCRAQPSTSPYASGPVVLVTPDTGPSELQRQLASLPPASSPPAEASIRIEKALDGFHGATKGRRGYIAIDKPLYQPGESIWFRTFDLASADLSPGERDITTFKLISPRGSTVIEKRVLTENGGAANDFVLPAGVAGGEYILRAESDRGTVTERKVIVSTYQPPRIKKKLEFLRKAYGPGDTVMATVELHRATGEAMAAKTVTGLVTLDGTDLTRTPVTTDAQGNAVVQFTLPTSIQRGDGLLTILVDDGGVTESVQKRIPITLADLQLSMFAEGGDPIAGLPTRIYFAAKNALDKPADIEGKVVDDHGATVALVRSYHDGMGRFDLVPDPRRSYKLEITRPTGIARTFALPAAKASGCALQAIDDFGSARAEVRVAVWCTQAQDVVTTAVLREKRVATVTTAVRAGAPTVIALPVPVGTQGAVRVTVFDQRLAPQAERLVYRNRGADLKIAIKPDRATYNPRDQVSLAIEATGPDGKPVAAELAVSVVDDTVLAFADDKQATLLARLYLEAEMPGQKIEEPNFYFGADAKAPAAIDLVLGTQGWRRFDWTPAFAAPAEPAIEDPWTFTGEYWNQPKKPAVRLAKKKPADVQPEGQEAEELAAENDKVVAHKVAEAKPAPNKPRAARDDDAEDPAPLKKMARAEAEDEPMMAPPAVQRAPMADMAGGDMADDGWGGEADMMESPARGIAVFDNQGFDVGGEAKRGGKQIRAGRNRAQEEYVEDPYCCLVPTRQFPMPSYELRYDGPRTDFRETLLWAPRVATDAAGKASLSFYLSDEVTSFKVTAEAVAAGKLGRGEALVQSKKPVSLAVKLPLEVNAGDRIRLPVTISNETDQPYTASLAATFGKAFKLRSGGLAPTLSLAPNERRATFYDLEVVGDGKVAEDGKIAIAVEAANLRDDLEKTIVIAPIGFPQQVSVSGTLSGTVRHEVLISDVMPGTMRGMLTLYPSPLATMVQGTEAMIAEPGGCFEQASSTNYPNIMILGYLEENKAASPAIVERANKALDKGYALLTGYETQSKGYEWFGSNPGHEALTAYGLMEFKDMSKVYGAVDRTMVDRTRSWLRGRRDGKGGFQRNGQALDSFGAASPEVTDGYITYALTEAGEKDLEPELARQQQVATTTKDPYLLAMAAKTLVNARPKDEATRAAVNRLVGLQTQDGSFSGADHSITRSGGEALTIESTSIAAMAMMAAGPEYMPAVRRAVEWINAHRNGLGGYGSTQSTVLALKALTQYAKESRRTEAAGTVILTINGEQVGKVSFAKGHQGALELPLGEHLRPGKNVIEVTLESPSPLPYSGLVSWGSKVPASHPSTKVALSTSLGKTTAKLGEGVHMDVRVTNTTKQGIPMTLARVGLPGGLTFQTWQLQELRDKKLIDFYETRAREVILYFRAMPPGAVKDVPLELMATVPGTFTSPASRAYLYYTNEHKHWVEPTTVTVTP